MERSAIRGRDIEMPMSGGRCCGATAGRRQDRRDAPASADRARGRRLLPRLDRVRNGGFSAGRRAGGDRDAAAGAGARRSDRSRGGRPDPWLHPVHRVEGHITLPAAGRHRARPYAASSAFRYPCPAENRPEQAAWGDSSRCGIPQSDRDVAHPLPPAASPLASTLRERERRGPQSSDASTRAFSALAIPQVATNQSGARNPVGI
jgi:hypothetical protein